MYEWRNLTSDEIDALGRNLPVIVPVGLIESHGPHLAVSVDVDSADYFARELAKRTGAILVPSVNYGFADEMSEYPGTLGLSVETFTAVITDICKMLCARNFKKVIFFTGHGANKIPIELAFYKVWEVYPDFKGICWNWWSDAGIQGIHHADKGETEVALAIGVVSRMDRVKDFSITKSWYKIRSRFALNQHSGGVNGYPSQADPENGRKIIEKAISVLADKVLQAIKE